MKQLKWAVIFMILFNVMLYSQQTISQKDLDQCGTMDNYARLKQEDPAYEQRLNDLEKIIQEYLKENRDNPWQNITIPVVVHVVYKTSAQNIPNQQIYDQIRILNEDFRKLNADAWKVPTWFAPYAADCQINFCLATKDPRNKTTTGIIRKSTTKASFLVNDDVKFKNRGGSDAWPTDKYLNIWVCNIDDRGIIGYAQFPGGYAAGDGVVVDYQAFGTSANNFPEYNLGRTAVHEVGHWLNLRHTWGDDGTECTGTDYVDDTPNQGGPNTGGIAVNSIIISCDNGPYGDMWMNYMNYTWHISRYLFTTGQTDRMQAIFVTDPRRMALLTSNGCGGNNRPLTENESPSSFSLMQNYPNPFNPSTTIRFNLPLTGFITLKIFDVTGKEVTDLVNGQLEAGMHSVVFNSENFATGVYYYRLESMGNVEVKKMLLIK